MYCKVKCNIAKHFYMPLNGDGFQTESTHTQPIVDSVKSGLLLIVRASVKLGRNRLTHFMNHGVSEIIIGPYNGTIDNKNFTNYIFVPELASSLFDNVVKILCAQAQARALPQQH